MAAERAGGTTHATAAAPVPLAARTFEIDGVRGWASFVVLLFHVYWEMLGGVLPEIRNPWLGMLLNDRLAIVAFFILSGDALGSAYFHRGRGGSIARQLFKRYLRLSIPVVMSCLMVYVVLRSGLDFHRDAARLMHTEGWLGRFLNFEPSFGGLLRYCFWDVYVTTEPRGAYNPFLWTMQVEMLGSLFVFALCAVWHRLPRRALVVGGLTALLSLTLPLMAAFSLGFLFSHARSVGLLARWRADDRWQWASLGVIAVAFALSTLRPGVHTGLLVASVLLLCVYTQRRLCRFFDNGLSRRMAMISFPLYLVQFPVLISLMSGLLLRHAGPAGQPPALAAMMGIALLTIVVSLVLAAVFAPIEAGVRRVLDAWVLRAPARRRGGPSGWAGVAPAPRLGDE